MIYDIIRQINAEGVTVLLVEQNAKAALQVAHTGYVMETGKICFSGSGKELLADGPHPQGLPRRALNANRDPDPQPCDQTGPGRDGPAPFSLRHPPDRAIAFTDFATHLQMNRSWRVLKG